MTARLLVTGATGYLGGRVVEVGAAEGWDVVAVGGRTVADHRVDVVDADAVGRLMARCRPDAVVHAAYVAGGDRAAAVIEDGSAHVAAAAARVGARLVHVSSDAVFGGRDTWIEPDDAPDPVHAYGRHKAAAERLVLTRCPDAVVVRPSLIVGGAARPGHQEALVHRAATGDDIAFFTDEIRCPVHVDDVAAALVRFAEEPAPGVHHAVGPDDLDRLTLARLLARSLGLDPDLLRGGRVPTDRPRPRVLRLRANVPGIRSLDVTLGR